MARFQERYGLDTKSCTRSVSIVGSWDRGVEFAGRRAQAQPRDAAISTVAHAWCAAIRKLPGDCFFKRSFPAGWGSKLAPDSVGVAAFYCLFCDASCSLEARAAGQGKAAFEGGTLDLAEIKVEEGAEITTADGGAVLMFAPKVVNEGKISTPEGQTILGGVEDRVYLYSDSEQFKHRGCNKCSSDRCCACVNKPVLKIS